MNKSILKYYSAPFALLLIASCSSSDSGEAVANATNAIETAAAKITDAAKNATASGKSVVANADDPKKVIYDGTTYTFAKSITDTVKTADQFSTNTTGDKLLIVKQPEDFVKTTYVGLAAYVEGTNPTLNKDNDDDGEDEPYNWDSIKSSGMALQGELTPIADLPQKADYSGDYWVSFETSEVDDPSEVDVEYDTSAGQKWSSTQPGFTATADFASNKVTGKLYGEDGMNSTSKQIGGITGDITGNAFEANLKIPQSTDDDGSVNPEVDIPLKGGFFGPAAAEIGGTGYSEEKLTETDYFFDENGNPILDEDGKHKSVETEVISKASIGFVGTKQ